MNKFRLKKEAVPFFNEKHATSIYNYSVWKDLQVEMKALEEVQDVYVKLGHQSLTTNGSSLCGWNDKGSHFHFTIYFPSSKHREHDEFSKGRNVREMIDKIQNSLDTFFDDFVNDNPDLI